MRKKYYVYNSEIEQYAVYPFGNGTRREKSKETEIPTLKEAEAFKIRWGAESTEVVIETELEHSDFIYVSQKRRIKI